GDPHGLASLLRGFLAEYRQWFDGLSSGASSVPLHLAPVAKAQLIRIRERIDRIDEGINLLESNDAAFEAFRFANEAMARAQARTTEAKSKPGGPPMDVRQRIGS